MPLTLRTHVTEKVPGSSNESRVIRTHHYIRVVSSGHPPLYIQDGQVFSEGGPLVDEIPDWFWAEACKCTDDALRAVKFEIPLDKVQAVQNLSTTSEPQTEERGRRRR